MVKYSMLNKTIRTIFLAALLLTISKINAYSDPYPSLFSGIRPLGMGNAFTAIADDDNALFYNPAGLSDISGFQLGVINPLIEVSDKSIDLINDANDADLDDTGETTDLLRKYVGEPQHLRVALYPNVGFKVADIGIMVSAIAQGTADIEVRNPTWPEAHMNIVTDTGVIGGLGAKIPFVKGLRAGMALKMLSRESLDEVYTAADIAAKDFDNRLDDDKKTGSGATIDLGVIYTLPFTSSFDTDIALSIQNLVEMDMDEAKDIDRQVNLGIALKKKFGGFKVIGSMDYQDLTSNIGNDNDFPKRIHMGAEVQFPTVLSLRGGINQGYWSAGATIDLWVFRFDFATYSEEVGAYAGQKDDRRYLGQITIGW